MKFSFRFLCLMLCIIMLLTGCTNAPAESQESDVDGSTTFVPVQTTKQDAESTTIPPQIDPPKIDPPQTSDDEYWEISEEEFNDKMLGGWLAEMVGVSWAASTEFDYRHQLMPLAAMPTWSAELINNAYNQDDLYVEIPFVAAMAEHGAFCDVSYMAENFKNSTFNLWHANMQGRDNLRLGIPYPQSGMYGIHADDIDWQIEADFLGMMYPGLVSEAASRSFEIGHIMNYGDGVYGGVFIAAMHAAAYSADSVEEIIEAGLAVIPENTKFRDLMDDVMESYHAGDSFETNWQKVENKWGYDQICGKGGATNIDAKLNSAYVLLGLLYGNGDLRQTIIYATRCGQDSDCNPSSAASIIGNYLGASKLERLYTAQIQMTGKKFSHTDYSLQDVLDMCKSLTVEILTKYGATLKDGVWRIPVQKEYVQVPYEQTDEIFHVMLLATESGGKTIQLQSHVAGIEKIAGITVDMGDGYVAQSLPKTYTYKAIGKYRITYTAVGSNGNRSEGSLEIEITKEEIKVVGTPICSQTAPNGGGSKSLSTICDGVIPFPGSGDLLKQYDTFYRGTTSDFAYAGLTFDSEYVITAVDFVEGVHFYNGGWFVGEPYIELLIDGRWVKAQADISTPYPNGEQNEHGLSYECFTFTLQTPSACRGVRVAGKPGGSATFISIGEIVAYGK